MNAPARGTPAYRTGLLALLAAVIGAVVASVLRLDPHLNPDSYSFEAIAHSLLAGRGFEYREPMFPSLPMLAFRSPGYSAFLALGLLLGGIPGAIALQGAVCGVTAALVGGITRRLAGDRAAWIAFALRIVWPIAWWNAAQLMSEGFFEFTLVFATWLALEAHERGRLGLTVAAGVMLGVSVLTRPVGLGCALALALWLLVRRPRHAFVLAAVALLVWLPWPIRNAIRLHAFVPLLTTGGVTAWNVNSGNPPIVGWTYMSQHTELGEVGLDHHFAAATRAIIQADPVGFVKRTLHSLVVYVGPMREHDRNLWLHRFAMLALLPALAWGAWRRRLTLPALVWVLQGALTAAVVVYDRYRFPTEWCVVVAAAIGLEAASQAWGGRRTALASAAALLACVAVTLVLSRG